MTKELHEMTDAELNALPVYQEFGATRYEVGADGTVTLPNGRVVSGLIPGGYLNVPYQQNRAAFFMGENTPMFWADAEGVMWRPVRLVSGEWLKERA